jgi:hypothetical protein
VSLWADEGRLSKDVGTAIPPSVVIGRL